MKVQTSRFTIFATLLGLTLGTAVTAAGVNAADLGPILEGATHDYDGSPDTYTVVSKRSSHISDNTEIVLDEPYHDYNRSEVLTFNEYVGQAEEAEFAAFEKATNVPWEISNGNDW